MNLAGSHQLFYVISLFFSIYAVTVFATLTSVGTHPIEMSIRKNRKYHIIALVIFALLLMFNPFKFESQSDAARTAVRESFDAPTTTTSEMVETSNFTYSGEHMSELFQESRDDFNKARQQ